MKNKIMLYPCKQSKYNLYINNLYKTICNEYEVISYDEIKKGLREMLSADVYHLNWYENISNDNKLKMQLTLFKRKIFIYILKFFKKKIVWTVHNNLPHELNEKVNIKKFIKFIAKKSDKIHIMCKETLNNDYIKKYKEKIVLIPHGDYINNYGHLGIDIKQKYKIERNKKIILFSGMIRKYKNIELLLEAFEKSELEKSNFVLLICGLCSDENYKVELTNMKHNENIKMNFNFIRNEEMADYLEQCEILVAPYDKTSSLNSGTLIMAMSYKKSFICPLIGAVKDIEKYDEILYTYDYDKNEDHLEKLIETLKKVGQDVSMDNSVLKKKGKLAYEYIKNNQTWEIRKNDWINLYKF